MNSGDKGGCGCGPCGCGGGQADKEALRDELSRLGIGEFMLAAQLASYPHEGTHSTALTLIEDIDSRPRSTRDNVNWMAVRNAVALLETQESLEDLRAEYNELFETGKAAQPLNESAYGPPGTPTKQSTLADLAGFYKAYSLESAANDASREMIDHIAVELEFYGLLLSKEAWSTIDGDREGVETIRRTRKAFLEDHLGRFIGAVADAPAVAGSAFFGPLFAWCRDLIDYEAAALSATIQPLRFAGRRHSSAAVGCCGSCS